MRCQWPEQRARKARWRGARETRLARLRKWLLNALLFDSRLGEQELMRDGWKQVACVAACGLMQQGISLLSTAQQVQL